MNILFIKHFIVGFMVSEIPRVSVFGYFPLHNYFSIQSLFQKLLNYLFIIALFAISVIDNFSNACYTTIG